MESARHQLGLCRATLGGSSHQTLFTGPSAVSWPATPEGLERQRLDVDGEEVVVRVARYVRCAGRC